MLLIIFLLCTRLVSGQQNFEQSWPFERDVSAYDTVYKKFTPSLYYNVCGYFKMHTFLKRRQLLGGYLRHVVHGQNLPQFQDIVKLLQQKTDLYPILVTCTPDELKKLAVISEMVYSLDPAWDYRYKAQGGFVLYPGYDSSSDQFERDIDTGYTGVHRMAVDFRDTSEYKPGNENKGVDLLIGAHVYWCAWQLRNQKIKNLVMLGHERGAGVIARLVEHMKPSFQPQQVILLAPKFVTQCSRLKMLYSGSRDYKEVGVCLQKDCCPQLPLYTGKTLNIQFCVAHVENDAVTKDWLAQIEQRVNELVAVPVMGEDSKNAKLVIEKLISYKTPELY